MTCEKPQFFTNRQGVRLFGVLHLPTTMAQRSFGVVYCAPLFEEKLWSHRIAVNFARFLCAIGIPVLRFDYFGDGESEGLFEDASVRSRVCDIEDAAEFLRSQASIRAVIPVGLGYGGTLAVSALAASTSIAGVVAWQPIMNGGDYIQNILRTHLSAQMVVHRKIAYDRPALVNQIESGQTVNVEGYEIGKALYSEMLAVDMPSMLEKTNRPILVQQVSPSTSIERAYLGISTMDHPLFRFEQVCEQKFWLQQKSIFPPCQSLFDQTLDWLLKVTAF